MYSAHNVDELAAAVIDLMSLFASPRRDELLLREAGVSLDRALFPLLVRLAMTGPVSVAELADQVGRDHTTVSRQLAKLESRNLVSRHEGDLDRRVRTADLTPEGETIVVAIATARRRLLSRALDDWTEADRSSLANLTRRFVGALSNLETK